MTNVYPVIHHRDSSTTLDQAKLAFECKADGVFLISMYGDDSMLGHLAAIIKDRYPHKRVGINFLSLDPYKAIRRCGEYKVDMCWMDACGIHSDAIDPVVEDVQRIAQEHNIEVFGSVAFKYQPPEPNPLRAAKLARLYGFTATTSGEGTGSPPTVDKVRLMSEEGTMPLAVASGMDPNNVEQYVPYLSDILVATGVAMDMYHFDYELLRTFIARVKRV